MLKTPIVGSTVVEHLPHHLKVKGSSLSAAAVSRNGERQKLTEI